MTIKRANLLQKQLLRDSAATYAGELFFRKDLEEYPMKWQHYTISTLTARVTTTVAGNDTW